MIPTPPNHCIIPRHNSVPAGKSSNSVKTVDPVVVKPDIASKNASVTLASCGAPIRNGSAPKIGSTTQVPVVKRKVCCSVRPSRAVPAQDSTSAQPESEVTMAEMAKVSLSPRPSRISASIGRAMVTPRAATSNPIT